MSVPLPTPLGPVTTRTLTAALLAPEETDELAALALGQAADRLRRRDPALREDAVHLHAPVLRHRQQQVEDLGRLEVLGRVEQETVDLRTTSLEIPLRGGRARADLLPSLTRVLALRKSPFGGPPRRWLRRGLGGGGRHAA